MPGKSVLLAVLHQAAKAVTGIKTIATHSIVGNRPFGML
jgi:hypothetical protein